jgi:pimeloyl-ACP methyl ester carboxylesterase
MQSNSLASRVGTLILGGMLLGLTQTQAQDIQSTYDVDGNRLYLHCMGKGTPTVLLTTGLGQGTDERWKAVMPEVAKITRVCGYDRVGVGKSGRSSGADTIDRIAKELHKLLKSAKIEGPLVMVGQGFGAFTVRIYADTFKKDMAGAVLIQPHHDDLNLWAESIGAPIIKSGKGNDKEAQEGYWTVGQMVQPMGGAGDVDWAGSVKQIRSLGTMGNIPLRVMVRPAWRPPSHLKLDAEAIAKAVRLEARDLALQVQMVRLSTQGRLVMADQTIKDVIREQPDLVVKTIADVVTLARK